MMSQSLTYNDMLGAYQPYPAPIRPYLLRAQSHPVISTLLTKSFMRVLIDIVGRSPISDPSRPLWLRVDIVAGTLDISIATVKRAIRFLKSQGWLNLHAPHDGRNNWGEFCAREYLLGTELRTMLGLPSEITAQGKSANERDLAGSSDSIDPADEVSLTAVLTAESITEKMKLPCFLKVPQPGHDSDVIDDITHNTSLLTAPVRPIDHLATATPTVAHVLTLPDGVIEAEPMNALPCIEQKAPSNAGNNVGMKAISIPNPVVNNDPGSEMSYGLYRVNKVFLKEASFKEEAFQIKNQETNPETGAKEGFTGPAEVTPASGNLSQPVLARQPRLPGDLLDMAETLKLSTSGICALMRQARQVNQRLQDIWRVRRDQLVNAGIREGRAYRYIQFLLQSGEDFAFRARQAQIPKPPAAAMPDATPMPEQTDIRIYRNKRFTGNNGLQVRIHGDGSAAFTDATQSNSYVCPADMGQIYDAIASGKLWLLEE